MSREQLDRYLRGFDAPPQRMDRGGHAAGNAADLEGLDDEALAARAREYEGLEESQAALVALVARGSRLSEPIALELVARSDDQNDLRAVMIAATGLPPEGSAPVFVAIAKKADAWLRYEVAQRLAVAPNEAALDWFAGAVTDPSLSIARTALRAFETQDDPRARSALRAALQHPEAAVRHDAIRRLADLGDRDALPAIRETMASEGWLGRRWVRMSVRRLEGSA